MSEPQQSIVKYEPGAVQQALKLSGSEPVMAKFSALTNYLDVWLKHQALILTVAFLVVAVVTLYTFKVQPIYRGTARVEIESETPLVQSLTDLFRANGSIDDATFLATQVDVLQSDNIAWRTIEQLQLGKEPGFKEIGVGTRSPSALQTALTDAFKRHLIIERQRETRMVAVNFESADPRIAANVANAVVENYIEYSFRLKYDATRQASAWMEQQLDDLKNKVQKSQQALVDYETKNSMVNVGDKESVSEQKLSDLSRDLTIAQDDRVRTESIAQLVTADPSRVRFVAQSSLLEKLQQSEADLSTQYADASQAYGPTFPKLQRLQAQLDEVRSLVTHEQKRIVDTINNNYNTAKAREDLLAIAVGKQKTEVEKFNQLSIQHNLLKRDFDSNQALYDNLMQRMKDATVSAGLRATNIHMIDRALPPAAPSRPRKARNILIGSVAGLILGFLCALIREAMDYSIKGAEEIEMLTGVPTLSIIPHASNAKKKLGRRNQANGAPEGLTTTLIRHPESAVAEAFRALRTSILLSQPDHAPQVLLITSPSPGEGKTSSAVNLALALAQKSGQALLIDADFRRPGVANSLGIPNKPGLSNVLTGGAELSEVLVSYADLPALSVLPTGPHPPNPAELLSSPAMESLLKDLRTRFASIVIDSPPVLLITDATILANMVDGVIMIAESEKTTRGALVRAFRVINLGGGKILGAVLNKVDVRRDGYYGHYNYGYGYGYYHKHYVNEN